MKSVHTMTDRDGGKVQRVGWDIKEVLQYVCRSRIEQGISIAERPHQSNPEPIEKWASSTVRLENTAIG